MRFWKKKYGNDIFIDIEYEKLVSDTVNTTKKLWDYCGLEGDFSLEKEKPLCQHSQSTTSITGHLYDFIKKTRISKL